ncbi:helix-turn-helix domain-containing protein [Actinocorallia lasiicapitis]
MVHRPAAPALRPYVAWYHGYREVDGVPGLHRGLPSPLLTLIFTFEVPLRLAAHPDGSPARSYDTLVGGLHTSPAVIAHDGVQCGVQLGLLPWGARALFGVPAGELSTLCLDASEVLPGASELWERLAHAGCWAERFAAIDRVLLRALGGGRRGLPMDREPYEVTRAWELLERSGGAATVTELAHACGWSERHLRNRFAAETGLTPKAAGRIFRFERAKRLIETGGRDFAEVAAAAGYFDQAHLAREFNALTGLPPSKWLAEEFRNVQAKIAAERQDGDHE